MERGVYPHVPGDGRELVATVPDAVKVRAADGRAVTGVDLSPFISHLPGRRDTASFTSKNASGSTSQAASDQQSRPIEAGATALLAGRGHLGDQPAHPRRPHARSGG